MEWLFLIIGLVAGAGATWLVMRASLRAQRQQVADQRQQIEQLRTSFDSLSRVALKENSESFLQLAKSTLDAVVATAKGDIGQQHEAIKGTIKPLSEALSRYEEQMLQMESKRERSLGELFEKINQLRETESELKSHTENLADALRRPEVRGQWGELTLRRTVELAGMSSHCVFVEQATTGSTGAADRPDMIVQLPGEREIVVDSKASMIHYVDAEAESDPALRAELLQKHATAVRSRIKDLASKDYQSKFAKAADFVVLFIPQEAFYAAAVEADKTLLEDAAAKSVFVASPTILITLLRAVALGWREEQIQENARRISELGGEIHERIAKWLEHYGKVGKALDNATSAYNESIGSLESRVLVTARKFKELGTTAKDDLPPIAPVDSSSRAPMLFSEEEE
jgi:DNA recombination protein RmuC